MGETVFQNNFQNDNDPYMRQNDRLYQITKEYDSSGVTDVLTIVSRIVESADI